MGKPIKKYRKQDWSNYIVDGAFNRTGNEVYTVHTLTPDEAKDLICYLMDCIGELSNAAARVGPILEKYNFK